MDPGLDLTPPAAPVTVSPAISSAAKRKHVLSSSPKSPSCNTEHIIVRRDLFEMITRHVSCKQCSGDVSCHLVSHHVDTSVAVTLPIVFPTIK